MIWWGYAAEMSPKSYVYTAAFQITSDVLSASNS